MKKILSKIWDYMINHYPRFPRIGSRDVIVNEITGEIRVLRFLCNLSYPYEVDKHAPVFTDIESAEAYARKAEQTEWDAEDIEDRIYKAWIPVKTSTDKSKGSVI